MDSSDDDTFEESNAEEEEEEEDAIDEIIEDDDDTDDGGLTHMSLDHDDSEENAFDPIEQEYQLLPTPTWPPTNISNAASNSASSKKKPGIVFLSSIPPGFNVSSTIGFFSQFGKVGRVFLQPGKCHDCRSNLDNR